MEGSIGVGVNLRVAAYSTQGGRKYMEDMFSVAYQLTADGKDLLYAYFGIFDGHGGEEAALYAKQHLMDNIVSQEDFWSEDDQLVLEAIKTGFVRTHQAMWKDLENWPRKESGLPSTSGTTASIAFVRRDKMYIGHVGDTAIILGCQDPEEEYWRARPLTKDHKPECTAENTRITEAGGKVVKKSGVSRVVWNRPGVGHKGPIRRSTTMHQIPFLAVARSLGDLWSYNSEMDRFVVSPEPDVSVVEIDANSHRCFILASDGVWNMMNPQHAINSICFAEKNNEKLLGSLSDISSTKLKNWINPSKRLVDRALDLWDYHGVRADNISVVTVVIDSPKAQELRQNPQKDSNSWSESSSGDSSPPSSPVPVTSGAPPVVDVTPISKAVATPSTTQQMEFIEMSPLTPPPRRRRSALKRSSEDFVQPEAQPLDLRRGARHRTSDTASLFTVLPAVSRNDRAREQYNDDLDAFVGCARSPSPLPGGSDRLFPPPNYNGLLDPTSTHPRTRSQRFELHKPSPVPTGSLPATSPSAPPEVVAIPTSGRKTTPHPARSLKKVTSKPVDKNKREGISTSGRLAEAQERTKFVPRRTRKSVGWVQFSDPTLAPENRAAKRRGRPATTRQLDTETSAEPLKRNSAKRRKETSAEPQTKTTVEPKTKISVAPKKTPAAPQDKTTVEPKKKASLIHKKTELKKKASVEPQTSAQPHTSADPQILAEPEKKVHKTRTRKPSKYYKGRRVKRSTKK